MGGATNPWLAMSNCLKLANDSFYVVGSAVNHEIKTSNFFVFRSFVCANTANTVNINALPLILVCMLL